MRFADSSELRCLMLFQKPSFPNVAFHCGDQVSEAICLTLAMPVSVGGALTGANNVTFEEIICE